MHARGTIIDRRLVADKTHNSLLHYTPTNRGQRSMRRDFAVSALSRRRVGGRHASTDGNFKLQFTLGGHVNWTIYHLPISPHDLESDQ